MQLVWTVTLTSEVVWRCAIVTSLAPWYSTVLLSLIVYSYQRLLAAQEAPFPRGIGCIRKGKPLMVAHKVLDTTPSTTHKYIKEWQLHSGGSYLRQPLVTHKSYMGVSTGGSRNSQGRGWTNLLFCKFLPKTAWKWKNLDQGVHVPDAPIGSFIAHMGHM